MLFTDDTIGDEPEAPEPGKPEQPEAPERVQRQVAQIVQTIKQDKKHFKKAYDRMRRDMFVAMWGDTPDWGEENYRANIAGRHVKQKTAALYAKNPKAVATRKETMDFAVWDENPATLQMAYMTLQQAQLMASTASVDPMTGMPLPPQLPPGFEQAMAVIQDFQSGYARRQEIAKLGKTLEILFAYAMREQKPVDFKRGMKQVVRRTVTCGVGYVELAFQREYGPRPTTTARIEDARARLDHLARLSEEIAEGEIDEDAPERAELEASIQALMGEEQIVLREGLVIDYPQSTRVIPDRLTKTLDGFVGARHLTLEYLYTVNEVKELFGIDIGGAYKSWSDDEDKDDANTVQPDLFDDDTDPTSRQAAGKGKGMVCVWKHFDKTAGLVYYIADGHPDFLRPPAAPDVFVEDFWPVYALCFNSVESEKELFPPSDVTLMLPMQKEYNRSRQGLREHRVAARPRWGFSNGALDDSDIESLKTMKPFDVIGMNKDPQSKLADILEAIPVPGVDPNLYETSQVFTDTQLVVGSQEAQFGGVSKATATESAIAANATTSSDNSSIEDLDSFLSTIARASGQILMGEMSAEKVTEIVGPGAFWPEMTLEQIASELFLEVEAGSTGKPNQAVEIDNWKQMLPFLLQLPGIEPTWLARETLRRLDDRMDLTEAIASGIPSIAAQNSNSGLLMGPQPGADPASAPGAQGQQGSSNAPKPQGEAGSGPAFGSNQV